MTTCLYLWLIPLLPSFDPAAEKQEAERKRIEAQGISDFQKIVSQVLP